jgi:hypothetical protein
MHVAVRQADQGRGDAAASPEDYIGVRPAGGRDRLVLKRNLLGFSDCLEPGHDLGVVRAAVSQGRPLADLHVTVLGLADGRVICRVSHIDHHGHVGLEGVGNLPGAQAADFLHDVRHDTNLSIEFAPGFTEQTQRLGHREGADAIVERPGHSEVVAKQLELVGQGNGVANAHQFLRLLAAGNPDIDEQVVNLRRFWLAFEPHQVRGNVAHYAAYRTPAGVDVHPLRLGNRRVDAADLAHVNVTLLTDEIHRHGNLVSVRGKHQPGSAAFVEPRNRVPVGVGFSRVGERFHVVQPDALAARFKAGRAGRVN